MHHDEFAKLTDDEKWAALEKMSEDEIYELMRDAARQLPKEQREWLAEQFEALYTGEDDNNTR